MNLILFEPEEIPRPLPRADPRSVHVLEVLRRKIGDAFDVGVVNGPRGKATLTAIDAASLVLAFKWSAPPPPIEPLTLIVGLPRPQTARDILRDATALGVAALHFVRTEKGEASYADSTLWTSGEWRRHVINGAEQACDTRLPQVTHGRTLAEVIAGAPPDSTRIALDNYEAPLPLDDWPLSPDRPLILAIGAERGWSSAEREGLRTHCFGLAHLGARVLRVETAVVASLAIARARLGWMK